MESIYYLGSIFLGLGLLALQGALAWLILEAGWFIYCKLTGREY